MRGWLYDGQSALRREVALSAEAGAVRLAHDDGTVEAIDPGRLCVADERADAITYGRDGVAGWRLAIAKPVPDELAAILPRAGRYGGWVDRVGLWPAVAVAATISAAVLAIGWFAPALLTPLVPESWERRYGEALVGDFGGKYCANPEGAAALAKLARRLDPRAGTLNIRVVDLGMVNAAALPGGNVVLFRGLIRKAEGPDEIAGVLAHEIAHVRERHVTEAMLRQFGIGLVLTTLGGSTAGNVEGALALSYTRAAEREADQGAIRALGAAGISPRATAGFFARLAKAESNLGRFSDAFAYLSSHPLSGSRERAFAASAKPGARYTPALTDSEWGSLEMICAKR